MEDLKAQRRSALAQANDVRSQRSRDKMVMKEGYRKKAADLLIDVPRQWQNATVQQFLLSVRGIGKARMRRICNRLCLEPSKRLSQLSEGRRLQLIAELRA